GVAALRLAAQRLAAAVSDGPGWRWFEPALSYDNARLPQALLAAGTRLDDPVPTALGLSTLDWYLGQVGLTTGPVPVLRCVGNHGCHAGRPVPTDEGDEQPLDAAATVEALLSAWRATGESRYTRLAQTAFAWFGGRNQAGLPVYDARTGGCRDGLSAHGVNANEGAESTLAYHQALGALRSAGIPVTIPPPAPDVASLLPVRLQMSATVHIGG
ncbi:MAG TPA: hypothetical protein VJT31_24445, partial [Rugosimonospora sp.]|nr:hypothetical protein [Rugosimonospora sp.]